jgi:hypothetical protein
VAVDSSAVHEVDDMCTDAAKYFDWGSHTVDPGNPVILEACLETQRSGEVPGNRIVGVTYYILTSANKTMSLVTTLKTQSNWANIL